MKRTALEALLHWKNQSVRKPILLDGAKQTGKLYLLEKIFGTYFNQIIRLDFLEQPSLANIFEDSLNPENVINNIKLEFGLNISLDKDLLIFDEIGKCPTYSWETARSEIEFLYKTDKGDIIPIEVKSGKRTQAKSLRSYINKYAPDHTLKLVGTTDSVNEQVHRVWPLYYASKISVI